MSNIYLRTDETEEAVSAIEMVEQSAGKVLKDIYQWKWVIVALHNALQCFMVLALKGSNGLLTLREDIAKKWLEAYRDGTEYPVNKLDYFGNLYEKIKSDSMLMYGHSKIFRATAEQNTSVENLCKN